MSTGWWLGHIIIGAWVAAGLVWLLGSFTTKATVRKQSYTSRLLEIWPVIAGAVLLSDNQLTMGMLGIHFVPHTELWEGVGAILTVAGVLIAIWARFYLGTNWSANITIKQDHRLICTGPYSFVRHPIYTGFLLAILGTAIYIGEVRGLLALVLATLGWKRKSLNEESFMAGQFGAEYTEYKQRVKGLIPFIW